MQNTFFILVGLIQLGIAIYGTREVRRNFTWYALLVLIVVYGLAYDNLAIASGALLGEGALTRALNAPRYWVHALFTPTMMIACFGALRKMGSKFAQSKTWHTSICLLATALIVLGSYGDILNLTLEPQTAVGVLRYVNTFEFMKGPPIPAVLTIIVVLIFGVMAWRGFGFKPLFIGSIIMFLMAGAAATMPLAQNIGEIAFATGLTLTQIRAARGF